MSATTIKHRGCISVVMPAYNAEAYIETSIRSLLAQTYQNWELIVVDDGSTDHTASIVRDLTFIDSRIRLIPQSSQTGPSAARNAGLDDASGDFLYFLDSDDILMPHAFHDCLRILSTRSLDVVTFDSEAFVDPERSPQRLAPSYDRRKVLTSGEVYDMDAYAMQCLRHHAVKPNVCLYMFRRDAVKDIRFPVSSRYAEESIYCFLACLKLAKIAYLGCPLHARRWRSDSLVGVSSWNQKIKGYMQNLNILRSLDRGHKNHCAHAVFMFVTLHHLMHCYFRSQSAGDEATAVVQSDLPLLRMAYRMWQGNQRLKQRVSREADGLTLVM